MNELTTISQTSVTEIDKVLEGVTQKHDIVSDINTPKAYIKKKMDMDYVEVGYMKKIADKHYPGWSWEVIKTEFAGTQAYVVHGRLKWYDSGIQRTGDMTAAHRIQRKRGTEEYVDLGNDIKAANTDCMKKAFNMYMNIADDVYRNQIVDLKEEDIVLVKEKMIEAGFDDNEINRIQVNAKKGKITKLDLDNLLKWIKEGPNKNKEQK